MRATDLIPFKAVAAELGYSRATLWRAARSGIAGFPKPIIRSRRVYWKQGDLTALEEAMTRFEGRMVFERKREGARTLAALEKSRALQATKAKRRARGGRSPAQQTDLFDGQAKPPRKDDRRQ